MKGKHTRKMSEKEKTHFSSFGRPRDSVRKPKKLTEDDKKVREACTQNKKKILSNLALPKVGRM